MIAEAIFIVLIGTAAPVAFTYADLACEYVRGKDARLFVKPLLISGIGPGCYAVENGCEMAERDRERKAEPMANLDCSKIVVPARTEWRVVDPAKPLMESFPWLFPTSSTMTYHGPGGQDAKP